MKIIEKTAKINSIFLAIVLIAGIFAAVYPSFIIGIQAQADYEYENGYGYDNYNKTFNCISNPTGCDLGRLNVTCVSDLANCNLIHEIFEKYTNIGGFKIHQPPIPDGSHSKFWTAASIALHVWIIDRIQPDLNIDGIITTIKFTTQDVFTGGQKIEGEFPMSLFKTTTCQNGVCEERIRI